MALAPITDECQVYLPVCVMINASGELISKPYIDHEGAPWMYVGRGTDEIYDINREVWFTHEERMEAGIEVLDKVLEHWGDK
jgi:hypothetical protein